MPTPTPSTNPVPSGAFTRRGFLVATGSLAALSACGGGSGSSGGPGPLGISAIPDQDPELLNRLYGKVASRVAKATGPPVRYYPLTSYVAVVRAFEVGDIHLAWMGGLTGVQARTRVPGSQAIAQRNIDANFHSLFIAHRSAGIEPFEDVKGLQTLAGHTFTFGSKTSTSGRLMPQYFIRQAELDLDQLAGSPGFSGSHDATIEAVASASFKVGAVNEQVWRATVKAGEVDLSEVVVLWQTPGYADYHWLARPDLDQTYGAGTTQEVTDMLFGLDKQDPRDAEILRLFGAEAFIPTKNSNYDRIEAIARDLGLLAT